MTVIAQALADYRTKDLPSQSGFQAWTYPPVKIATSTTGPGSGALIGCVIKVPQPMTISELGMVIRTAAAGSPANIYYGVFTAAGAQLGVSADVSAQWKTAGLQAATLTPTSSGSLSLAAGWVWGVVLVGTAGTAPNIGSRSVGGAKTANIGLLTSSSVQASTALPLRTFKLTGQGTTMPTSIASSISAGGLSPSAPFWMGVI